MSMKHTSAAGLLAAFLMIPAAAAAQDKGPAIPAPNAMKLSEIITKIEQRPQFQYVSELEWNEDGYYDITYMTDDKAKVEIKIDAVTGKPR
jgi:hypothetical protein